MSSGKCHDLEPIANICYFMGLAPYAWNSDKLCLELTSNKWKILHWKANIALYILYVFFLAARFIQISIHPDGVTTAAQMQTFISASLMVLAFFQQFWTNWETGHFLVNRIINLDEKCKNEFIRRVGPEENNLAIELRTSIADIGISGSRSQRVMLAVMPMLVILYTIRMNFLPDRANHLTSLLPNPNLLTILEKLPFLAIHCYIWMLMYFGTLLPYSIALFFGKPMEKNMCIQFKQRKAGTVCIKKFLRVYPQLRVLQLEYNDMWGNFQSYFLVLCVSSEILNLYQAVVLHTIRAIFVTGLVTNLIYSQVTIFAEHYKMSTDILNSCKSGKATLWFRKYVKSCRPLFTKNGSVGFFDKPLLLTLWSIVITNTTTLIVGNRHEKP